MKRFNRPLLGFLSNDDIDAILAAPDTSMWSGHRDHVSSVRTRARRLLRRRPLHQHNPQVGDGLSGLGAALGAMAKQGITMKYDKIHRVLGEGNFVLVVSEGAFGGRHTSSTSFVSKPGRSPSTGIRSRPSHPRASGKSGNGKF